jgi:hypothetical protein
VRVRVRKGVGKWSRGVEGPISSRLWWTGRLLDATEEGERGRRGDRERAPAQARLGS